MIRPLALSSYMARSSASGVGVGVGVALAVDVWLVLGGSTVIWVDSHPARTVSIASASARSMVRLYSRRIWTMWWTDQHWFRAGSHSAACFPLFWWRLTLGDVRVRFMSVRVGGA